MLIYFNFCTQLFPALFGCRIFIFHPVLHMIIFFSAYQARIFIFKILMPQKNISSSLRYYTTVTYLYCCHPIKACYFFFSFLNTMLRKHVHVSLIYDFLRSSGLRCTMCTYVYFKRKMKSLTTV